MVPFMCTPVAAQVADRVAGDTATCAGFYVRLVMAHAAFAEWGVAWD
jgi:hypothetical protein